MISGERYYFFQLCRDGAPTEYRVAKSFVDLYLRFGSAYLSEYHSIKKLNEVTPAHIQAIYVFLLQQIS